MLINALEKLENFSLGNVGYMPFYRVTPHTYGRDLPADIGYFPMEWSKLCPFPTEESAVPLFSLYRWYDYPLQRRVLIKSGPVPAVMVPGRALPDMVEAYDDGFHIYVDMDFHKYNGYIAERLSEECQSGVRRLWVAVYMEIVFRKVNAAGIRRGQKIIVAKEIMLKGEV